jgi:hypothetical protein
MRLSYLHRVLPLLALAAALCWLGAAPADDKDDKDFKPLFNGKDFTGLKFEMGKSDPMKTWSVKEGVIICTGRPNGYIYTDKSYKNYVIRYDWQYARPEALKEDKDFNGNSGLLVHMQEPHKVWPKCVEVQGMNKDHGHIFAIGGAKGQYSVDKQAQMKAIKPVGQWNTTEVISKDGELTAKINGTEVSKGKGDLTEGPIGLQSEGAEIHFRNIKIKELK